MTIVLGRPAVDGVREAMASLREWHYDEAPMQLHSVDIGWNYRFGTAETAAVVRAWSRDGRILAVGMLDSPTLVRMTVAPDAFQGEDLARRLLEDFSLPERGVLPEGAVSIEAPLGLLLHDLLSKEGWGVDEPWTPHFRDLTEPVEDPGVRINGRPRGPPWSRLRPGDHRGRGGRAAGDGLVERACVHAEFQRRRCRHVQAAGFEIRDRRHPRHRAGLCEKTAEEAPGRGLVAAVLYEDVEDVAVLVDSPPTGTATVR
jgi:hypothetical protein